AGAESAPIPLSALPSISVQRRSSGWVCNSIMSCELGNRKGSAKSRPRSSLETWRPKPVTRNTIGESMKPTLLSIALAASLTAQDLAPLRPPAVPLIAHDPYFSVWSTTDKLTDSVPTHWTGKPNSLSAAVRVDGKLYRVMGREQRQSAALDQTRLEVL